MRQDLPLTDQELSRYPFDTVPEEDRRALLESGFPGSRHIYHPDPAIRRYARVKYVSFVLGIEPPVDQEPRAAFGGG